MPGEGPTPKLGDQIRCNYVGNLDNGSQFTKGQDFKFYVGRNHVIKGWDVGFSSMKKGEKCLLRVRSDYGYGEIPSEAIPANSNLNYELEVLDFGPVKKEIFEMPNFEKVDGANKLKDEGNTCFKEGMFSEAAKHYDDAAELVEDVVASQDLYFTCLLNAAQAYIKLSDYPTARARTSNVLENDPCNIKALYRRAVCRNHLGAPDEAIIDLKKLLELDPDNQPAKQELIKAKKSIKNSNKNMKDAFKRMYEKELLAEEAESTKSTIPAPVSIIENPKVIPSTYYM